VCEGGAPTRKISNFGIARLAGGDADGAAGGDAGVWSLSSRRVQTLVVLLLIFIANQATRALPFYLVDFSVSADPMSSMNTALDFTSADYGLYATLGFTVPFTLASLVAGVAADSSDRLRLGGSAGIFWSACTASMLAATSYQVILGERALLGLSQAATNPASLSLIAELFPEARATASSIFGLGIYIGGGLASLGAALNTQVGWRSTCAVFGLVSVAVSLLAFTISDPRSLRKQDGAEDCDAVAHSEGGVRELGLPSFLNAAQEAVAAAPRTLGEVAVRTSEATAPTPARWLLLASALRFCAGFAILVWLPATVKEQFPAEQERFAVYNSLIKVFAGGASSLAGGVAADTLRSRGLGDRAGALFCAASSILAAPLWFLVLDKSLTFEACMGFLLVEYLVAESWLGPAIATLQSAVPPERRGAAQGVFSSLTALGNALPAALGLLAREELSAGLQASVSLCYVLSALAFVGAAFTLPEDKKEVPPAE